ncbi:MAG: helix-turn-helix transcriptional regulator [Negativicutes bacterium]|nr:helix-turn-helix transcriptional regulator [Negativicutes bacterium]
MQLTKPRNQCGPQLRLWRQQAGIKAYYVAYKIGVSKATYSQIEAGRRRLDGERLAKILAVLGRQPEEVDGYDH